MKIEPIPRFYDRIRELALEEKSPTATVALARYQRENDIRIIKELFDGEEVLFLILSSEYYALQAVQEYPHPEFYPDLVRIFERNWAKEHFDYLEASILYCALARYDNAQTLEFFERTINIEDTLQRKVLGNYLLKAITMYPTENFEKLKPRITPNDRSTESVLMETYLEN